MELSFNYYHRLDDVEFYLCNPDGRELFPIIAFDRKISLRFNDLSTLEFRVPSVLTKTDGTQRNADYYEYIQSKRIVLVKGVGYFQITSVSEDDNGYKKDKTVTAESLQTMLKNFGFTSQDKVYRFYNSEDIYDVNYNDTDPSSIPSVVGQLYQQLGIKVDLQDDYSASTKQYEDWTITYITSSLITTSENAIYRSFEDNTTTGYDFIVNDVEKAFNVVFIFDFENLSIAIKTIDEINDQANICMSFTNFVKNIKVEENADDIVTVLNCEGQNCDIRLVNPMGTNYIVDFSYYMDTVNHRWMSDDLINQLNLWKSEYEDAKEPYANAVQEYQLLEEKKSVLSAELSEASVRSRDLQNAVSQYWDTYKSKSPKLAEQIKVYQVGSVDLLNRLKIKGEKLKPMYQAVDESAFYTLFPISNFFWWGDNSSGEYVYITYTPITPDGNVINKQEIESYLSSLCSKRSVLGMLTDIISADTKKIIINIDTTIGVATKSEVQNYINTGVATQSLQRFISDKNTWIQSLDTLMESYYGEDPDDLSGIVRAEVVLINQNSLEPISEFFTEKFVGESIVDAYEEKPNYVNGTWVFVGDFKTQTVDELCADVGSDDLPKYKYFMDNDATTYCELNSMAYKKSSGDSIMTTLPSPTIGNLGSVYRITESFTTTTKFKEGAGITLPAYTYVSIVDINADNDDEEPVYKYSYTDVFLFKCKSFTRYTARGAKHVRSSTEFSQHITSVDVNLNLWNSEFISKRATEQDILKNEYSFTRANGKWIYNDSEIYINEMGVYWTSIGALTDDDYIIVKETPDVVYWGELQESHAESINNKYSELDKQSEEMLGSIRHMQQEINILNWMKNYPRLYRELSRYWIEGSYTNDNIEILDNTSVNSQYELSKELLKTGEIELTKTSQPKYSFSLTAINFINNYEYKELFSELILGRRIAIEKEEDGIWYYPALLGMDISLDDVNTFSLSFANATRLDDWGYSFADLVSQSSSTSKQVNSNWSNLISYVKEKETISDLLLNPLDATLRAAKKDMSNQSFSIDDTGISGRKESNSKFLPEQLKIINNRILFTDDGWNTAKTALGKISYYDEEGNLHTSYGLIAETIIGDFVLGNTLQISNQSGTFIVNDDGMNFNDQFIVDKQGNVTAKSLTFSSDVMKTLHARSKLPKPIMRFDEYPESSETGWHWRLDEQNDHFISNTFDGGDTWTDPVYTNPRDGKTVAEKYLYYLKNDETAPSAPIWDGTGNPPAGWYVIPQSVSETNQYLFRSAATVIDNVYGSWSTPTLFTNYAESGDTIFPVSLYYRTDSSTAPGKPTWDGSGNPPVGWSLTPLSVSATYQYEYVSQTTVTNGSYGAWSNPQLYTLYGKGVTISKIEYQAGTSPTSAPTGAWSTSIVEAPEGQYLWTKTTYSDNNVVYAISKQGEKGDNGSTIETTYLYHLSQTSTPPSYSANSYEDNINQYKWTETPKGTDSTNLYEFIIQYKKTVNGVTQQTTYTRESDPSVWSKYGSDADVNVTNVFNVLTENSTKFGVFTAGADGQCYINASYIQSLTLIVADSNKTVFSASAGGNTITLMDWTAGMLPYVKSSTLEKHLGIYNSATIDNVNYLFGLQSIQDKSGGIFFVKRSTSGACTMDSNDTPFYVLPTGKVHVEDLDIGNGTITIGDGTGAITFGQKATIETDSEIQCLSLYYGSPSEQYPNAEILVFDDAINIRGAGANMLYGTWGIGQESTSLNILHNSWQIGAPSDSSSSLILGTNSSLIFRDNANLYGDRLPTTGQKGQVFFLKINS